MSRSQQPSRGGSTSEQSRQWVLNRNEAQRVDTLKRKYGPDYMRQLGRKGRTNSPSGFQAMTAEQRREAGRKGGLARQRAQRVKKAQEARVK